MNASWLMRVLGMAIIGCLVARGQMFTPSGMRTAGPGAPNSRTFTSANGQIELVLEERTLANPTDRMVGDILASMSKRSGGSVEALWNASFKSGRVQFLRTSDVFVSDDGEFFLVAARNGNDFVLHRKERSIPLEPERARAGPIFLSFAEKLIGVDTIDGKRIVKMWDRDRNLWFGFDAVTGGSIEVEPATAEKWSEAMRQEILNKLYAARQEHLRRKLNKASAPLGKIASVAFRTNTVSDMREIDYEFLTVLRRPEDRKWIENLLDVGDENRKWGGRWFSDDYDHFTAEGTDLVKVRADWLLGVWDGKAKKEMMPRTKWGQEGELPRFALGKVTGTVRFATPINLLFKERDAAFRLRLVAASETRNHDATVEAEINHHIPNNPSKDEALTDELAFAFTTVRPGEYKLKAIWDKRAPFVNTNSAGPGDYESAWTESFAVRAGGVVSNLVLHCTNRVGGGESYYAVDETIRRRWKETGEYTRFTFVPDRDGGFDTFSRAAEFWIVKTNLAARSDVAAIARIGLRSWKKPKPNEIARPDTLVVQFEKRPEGATKILGAPGELRIVDEHGCELRKNYSTESKETVTFTFMSFPRAAASWRLVGTMPSFNARPRDQPLAFDYTVTNLARGAARAEEAGMELPALVDLGDVKMNVTRVLANHFDLQLVTTFMEGLTPSFTWAVQEAWAIDRHGNVIRPRDVCREEKSLRVVGSVQSFGKERKTLPFDFGIARSAFPVD